MTNPDAEAALEDATLDLFAELGWETVDAYHERYAEGGPGQGPYLGRATRHQVVLRPRLRAALERLNPHLPPIALEQAIQQLTRDRGALSLARANQEVYHLLKKGVKVAYNTGNIAQGEEQLVKVRVIDWERPQNNDFLVAQQFWITGEVYTKRADLVGFVNGLPLLFGELKAHYRRVKDAYRHNFGEYKATIPQLFWYTSFVILSNGSDARIGTITADWDYFSQWKKINDEGEEGTISLETLLRGTCDLWRFLDLIENYVLYQEVRGGLRKIVAMNHQYLGVENAIQAVRNIEENEGQLGVFWHTQGSGKSFSMVFFSQKVLRVVSGNWTFVVVTDRRGLDDQIYNNFARTGAVIEPEHRIRAQSGEHLKQLLREDHRYVFTLIQKFHTRDGGRYPTLSERDDNIGLTDEAHRSQKDSRGVKW
uniref:type I restriction endonuclease n=1 Tax=Thiohalocapsa sp. TaxID=2497641 RepID=UPI0025E591B9